MKNAQMNTRGINLGRYIVLALVVTLTQVGTNGWVRVTPLAFGAETRPNILVVMSDDHSTNALSVYGSYRNTTPRMDQLAHEGMRLTQCLVVNSI